MGSIPVLGRSPGEGNGNPVGILAWEIPWTQEPGGLQSVGSPKGWAQLSYLTTTKMFIVVISYAGLNFFTQHIMFSFASCNLFDLTSILCDNNIITAILFWLLFAFSVIFHLFTFNLFVFFYLKWISHRQHVPAAKSLELCLTFCYRMNHSLPGFSVHGIL